VSQRRDHQVPPHTAADVAQDTEKKRNPDPGVIDVIFQDAFNSVNILIFVNQPKDENTNGEKGEKPEDLESLLFQDFCFKR